MTQRLNSLKTAPDAMAAMLKLEEAVAALARPSTLTEMLKMRVSQINGCAFCLKLHAPAAHNAGLSQQQLDVLASWRESPAFSPQERAALVWSEALTRIEASHAPNSECTALAQNFSPQEQVEITLVITTINT